MAKLSKTEAAQLKAAQAFRRATTKQHIRTISEPIVIKSTGERMRIATFTVDGQIIGKRLRPIG